MVDFNPYIHNPNYELVRKSLPFQVKDTSVPANAEHAYIRHGRTYYYSTRCSRQERILAVVLVIFTLCVGMAFESLRKRVLQGKKIVPVNVLFPTMSSYYILQAEFFSQPKIKLAEKIRNINIRAGLDIPFYHITPTFGLENNAQITDFLDDLKNDFYQYRPEFEQQHKEKAVKFVLGFLRNYKFDFNIVSIKSVKLRIDIFRRYFLGRTAVKGLNETESAMAVILYDQIMRLCDQQVRSKIAP